MHSVVRHNIDMKKLLGIVVLGLLLSGNAYSHEDLVKTHLVCSHETGSSITLSFNKLKETGKEYIDGDTGISYVVKISDTSLSFFNFSNTDRKLLREWNIDRYSGSATLDDYLIEGTVKWNCRPAEKKF